MWLYEVSYNKEKLDVPCELSGTVMSLKESLAMPSGVKANHQKLIFKGKTLLNDEMLDLLGIKVCVRAAMRQPATQKLDRASH